MERIIKFEKPGDRAELQLRPCPFCGSTEIVYAQYKHAAGLRWMVTCCGCMAGIDPGYAQSQHVVRDMWNKRKEENTMKKFGVLARNRGMRGGMTSWCKDEDGNPLLFDTYDEAAAEAASLREMVGRVNNFTDFFPKEYTEE